MAYKTVQCVTVGCELEGVPYGIPFSMLTSANEAVVCGGCSEITDVVDVGIDIINSEHVAAVEAMNRPEWFGNGNG